MRPWDMETVVIVGASSSIGRAISSRFSAAERVITTYSSRMPEDSNEHTFHLDLREDVSIERFVEQLKKISLRIDVVIFLPAILPGKDLKGYSFEEVDLLTWIQPVSAALAGDRCICTDRPRWRLCAFVFKCL